MPKMPTKLKPGDEDFLPEVERRFLFDDAAVLEYQQANKSGSSPATAKDLFKSEQVGLRTQIYSQLYPSFKVPDLHKQIMYGRMLVLFSLVMGPQFLAFLVLAA